ncbi:Rhomboid family protein [compost metagenome]
MGAKKFALTYLLSGICGGLISIIYHGVGYMAGASGAIMGLFGAFLALLLSKAFEKNATKALTISTLIVLTIMLSNGLMQGVDNAAHFGGLVSGFIVCFILSNAELFRRNLSMSIRYMIVSVLTLVFAIVVLISTPNYQIRKYLELEREYLENAKAFIDIYIIPSDLSRTEKLEMIKTNGVVVWKKNELLVKQMLKLKLPKRQQYRVQFHQKMVKLNAEISTLLYKESVEHSKAYRDKIHLLTMEVNKARAELRENELAE